MQVECKPTLSPLVVFTFVGAAVFLDLIKVALFFVQAIPGIGTVIDVVVSEVIGFIEDVFILGGLGLVGASHKGTFGSWVMASLSSAVINAVPEIDDLPSTTIAVVFIVLKSKAQDKIDCAAKKASAKVAMERESEDQQLRVERAREVAARQLAANDNAQIRRRAA